MDPLNRDLSTRSLARILIYGSWDKKSPEQKAAYIERGRKLNKRMPRATYREVLISWIVGSFVALGFCFVLNLNSHVKNLIYNGGLCYASIAVGVAYALLFAPTVQRIHDVGKSAWWLLVPGYNIYLLTRGSDQPNKYGDTPIC